MIKAIKILRRAIIILVNLIILGLGVYASIDSGLGFDKQAMWLILLVPLLMVDVGYLILRYFFKKKDNGSIKFQIYYTLATIGLLALVTSLFMIVPL